MFALITAIALQAGADPQAVAAVAEGVAEGAAEAAAAAEVVEEVAGGSPVLMWAILGFVIVTITGAVVFSVYTVVFPSRTAADRLDDLTAAAEAGGGGIYAREDAAVERIAARLGRLAAASGDSDATAALRKTLKYAGYKSRRAIDILAGVRVAGLFLLPVFLSPVGAFAELHVAAFAMILGAAVGYYMPLLILHSQASSRQGELLRSFPDALDLLVSSVESGQSLDQAFKRVATEMKTVSPALSREFVMVNSEISAGIERVAALRHLEERTGIEEIRSLVNMLAQAERFGSSVANTLRMYSKIAREKRMARAEEAAGQVGSKLTVIMIVFLLPVLMAVLLGPSAIRIISNFGAE